MLICNIAVISNPLPVSYLSASAAMLMKIISIPTIGFTTKPILENAKHLHDCDLVECTGFGNIRQISVGQPSLNLTDLGRGNECGASVRGPPPALNRRNISVERQRETEPSYQIPIRVPAEPLIGIKRGQIILCLVFQKNNFTHKLHAPSVQVPTFIPKTS